MGSNTFGQRPKKSEFVLTCIQPVLTFNAGRLDTPFGKISPAKTHFILSVSNRANLRGLYISIYKMNETRTRAYVFIWSIETGWIG